MVLFVVLAATGCLTSESEPPTELDTSPVACEYFAEGINAPEIANLSDTSIEPNLIVLTESTNWVCREPVGVTLIGGVHYDPNYQNYSYQFDPGDFLDPAEWWGPFPVVECNYTSNGGLPIKGSGMPTVLPLSALLAATA
ncbi:MAG: hypothetical protein Q8L48_04560 [Archangium sp.]|nr:hypothetical protein [Archangium sp.]